MDEVLKFLTDNPVFYIATVDGGRPRVRPFGFVMKYEGKLWFCTNNQKNVYKQLRENPYFELCTASPDRKWLRLKGRAVFNSTPQAKAKALEVMPELKAMYSADDPIFEVFYVEEGEATFYSLTGETRTVKL
ncbi:MAG: pyridoxamine 5'-phosphate oxidase family protein [Pelotomaculum sp.]|uniref:Uncharacterized conserved protein n=1 Tax=Pelotomaculum thermopropionicum (strain DSM 13744 / JCM 10971 / SI) TaxID=370438 RepID=A5D5T2_PELTS|nr:pyridoxamine 5'-phosphate oxidase family protein [Pelotomaculum sp.]BAF58399.1 uncharacterized conserved protein [Pelotomaculum thermopropionicum SI]